MLSVLDLGTGNLSSVANAFHRIGAELTFVTKAAEVRRATALVLPGVGAFQRAAARLGEDGLAEAIRDRVGRDGTPLIGICLGMQLMAGVSEEHGEHAGLSLISGRVVRLTPTERQFKVPNIGWYDIQRSGGSQVLFPPDQPGGDLYFVHSYWLRCDRPQDVAATIAYSGVDVTAAVERGHIFGVQFHPEKSQDAGLRLLSRFLAYAAQHATG